MQKQMQNTSRNTIDLTYLRPIALVTANGASVVEPVATLSVARVQSPGDIWVVSRDGAAALTVFTCSHTNK